MDSIRFSSSGYLGLALEHTESLNYSIRLSGEMKGTQGGSTLCIVNNDLGNLSQCMIGMERRYFLHEESCLI
jgi:hypothetical protein